MAESVDKKTLNKKSCFEEWMKGDHVLLHLDSRKEGIVVPSQLFNNPGLTLKISYFFQGETVHDDCSICSYLRFGTNYFQCQIPWSAIWGISSSNGEQKIWPEDIPREILLQMAREKLSSVGKSLFSSLSKKDPPNKKTKPELKAVSQQEPTQISNKNSEKEGDSLQGKDPETDPTKKKKPGLTRVK
jgi:stringent starvation protein B